MSLALNCIRSTGLARTALSAALISSLFICNPVVAASTSLGSIESCQQFSGLPAHWGQDHHAGMVYIPAGSFTMGTTLGYAEERQETTTQVAGFWIDQTEVTVAQFADFVSATHYVTEAEQEGGGVVFHKPSAEELQQRDYAWWSYTPGANWRKPQPDGSPAAGNLPVTLVTYKDALAYAQWLGRDLPSEAEWEYAAKAGQQGTALEKEPRDSQGKPLANFWQGHFPNQNTQQDGFIGLAPVGCFIANAFQLYDMIGNVWEQTKDVYTPSHEPSGSAVLPVATGRADQAMVVKGGSHLCGKDFCVRYRASAREAHEANLPISHIGFRTVRRD